MKTLLKIFSIISIAAIYSQAYQFNHNGPYVSCVTSTSIVIAWQTDVQVYDNYVDYGPTSSYGSTKTGPAGWIIYDNQYMQYTKLENLQPSTTYHYRVRADLLTSGDYTFHTFPAPLSTSKVRIMITGDNRGSSNTHFSKIMLKMVTEDPDVILHVGDLTSQGEGTGSEGYWTTQYFTPISSVASRIWIAPTIGNHEFQGDANEYPWHYTNYFVLPSTDNSGNRGSGERYSFDMGSVHVISLAWGGSGGTPDWDNSYGGPHMQGGATTPQYEWIKSDLAAAKARGMKWIIGLGHYPYLNIETGHGALLTAALVADLFEKYGMDYFFYGHAHCYQRYVPVKYLQNDVPHWFYNGGEIYNEPALQYDPSGVRYVLAGMAGAPQDNGFAENSVTGQFIAGGGYTTAALSTTTAAARYPSYMPNNAFGYVMLEIEGDTCTYKAVRDTDWAVFDTETFNKANTQQKSISGNVRDGSALGISGVAVNLTGGAADSQTTDSNGAYAFSVSTGLSYVVTPTKTNYSFTPTNQSFASLTDNQTQNFTGAYSGPSYTISGTITNSSGVVMNAVTVALSGDSSQNTTTNSSGDYSFTGLHAGGAYLVIPTKTNYTFDPEDNTYSNLNSNQLNQDFTGNMIPGPPVYSISGYVRYSTGAALSGVTVSLTGKSNTTATTGVDGSYAFVDLSTGNYTITPVKSGYYISPTNKAYTPLNVDQSSQNFTGTAIVGAPTYSISGYVRTITDVGLGSVSLALTGKTNTTGSTDGTGYYEFVGLSTGAYTVTPSKTGYSFSSVNREYSYLNYNSISQDYIALAAGSAGEYVKVLTSTGNPLDVAVDPSNGDYYTCTYDEIIYSYDKFGAEKTHWCSGEASGIALDEEFIYAGEGTKVSKYTKDIGSVIATWGGASGGSGLQQFSGAKGLTVDGEYVYVADSDNDRIKKLSLSDLSGNSDSIFGDTILQDPRSVYVSGNYLYICDNKLSYIRKLTKDTGAQVGGEFATASPPVDAVVDSNGKIYVLTGSQHIYVYDSAGTQIGKWGGSIGAATGQFDAASGIGIDVSNNIYVADKNNNRIQVFKGYTVIAATLTYSISGYVKDSSSQPASNVSMIITGTASNNATTDTAGYYIFSSLLSGNYTITPSKTNSAFTPTSKTYTNLSADMSSQNFEIYVHISTEIPPLPAEDKIKLYNNAVNPVNNEKVTVAFRIEKAGKVKVNVFDLRGTLIATIVDEERNAGVYQSDTWDGKNKDGKSLPSGIYLIHIEAPGVSQTKKVCIIK